MARIRQMNACKPTHDPRQTALLILKTLEEKKVPLDRILEDRMGNTSDLSKRDRSLANAIIYGVLRWRGRLDHIIKHFSNTRLDRIDPDILNILRIGLFQVIHLTRIPVSAAVDTSVEMAKSCAPAWVVRYVNGLLRNAAKNHNNVPFPDIADDPGRHIAITRSFPEWLVQKWLKRFGAEETQHLCDAINRIPPITVRTNTIKINRDKLIDSLKNYVHTITATACSKDGVSFTNPAVSISETDAFKKGWFQVQDEAAQMVAPLLNPAPGNTVLDACAGLGGKTGHIAQLMNNRGHVVAVDRDKAKLTQLKSDMNRLGFSNVITEQHDLNNPFTIEARKTFDSILLDAPCSGLGVLRRNPDAKWSVFKKDLSGFKKNQQDLLHAISPLVNVSGVIVYAVCSMEPEENEDVIHVFLNNHKEFVIEKNPAGIPETVKALVDKGGYLKTFPHVNDMDGFFAVCLKRTK